MKENKYDDNAFFDAYSRFPRSVEGLSAAGEWHVLKRMLPGFKGKRVLDIGCGFGWHCIYAAENGAQHVVGIDLSEKMIAVAKEKSASHENVEYHVMAMEDIDFAPDSFDVVISSLAFHYTPDFEALCSKITDCLAPGGDFIFSAEHPVFTAQGAQDWVYDENGKPAHWPVDNYYYEGQRTAHFLGESVTKYHKTMTTYLATLLKLDFEITGFEEPQPDERLLDEVVGMRDEMRRPMMMIVSCRKR